MTTQSLTSIAREMGRARDRRVNASSKIEDIAGAIAGVASDYDDQADSPHEIRDVVAIAQSYFDGLAESYGLEPGEIVVHADPWWRQSA